MYADIFKSKNLVSKTGNSSTLALFHYGWTQGLWTPWKAMPARDITNLCPPGKETALSEGKGQYLNSRSQKNKKALSSIWSLWLQPTMMTTCFSHRSTEEAYEAGLCKPGVCYQRSTALQRSDLLLSCQETRRNLSPYTDLNSKEISGSVKKGPSISQILATFFSSTDCHIIHLKKYN